MLSAKLSAWHGGGHFSVSFPASSKEALLRLWRSGLTCMHSVPTSLGSRITLQSCGRPSKGKPGEGPEGRQADAARGGEQLRVFVGIFG